MGRNDISNNIHYCPFCGKSLGQQCGMKFCPFCGGNFAALHEASLGEAVKETGVGEDSLEQNTGHKSAGFAGGPEQVSAGSSQSKAAHGRRGLSSGYYSLVLKYCPADRQRLGEKLERILLRSPRAIQLALENAPCILVYKEKTEKVLKVLTACQNAGAAIVLATGDLDTRRHIKDAFPDFPRLSEDLQRLLPALPDKLWIGENIAGIYGVNARDKGTGALVVGEHALYFADSKYDWLAVSYLQVKGLYLSKDALEVEYQGCDDSELFYFADTNALEQAFTQLKKVSQREQGRLYVVAHCPGCGFRSRDGLGAAKFICPQCDRELACEIYGV